MQNQEATAVRSSAPDFDRLMIIGNLAILGSVTMVLCHAVGGAIVSALNRPTARGHTYDTTGMANVL